MRLTRLNFVSDVRRWHMLDIVFLTIALLVLAFAMYRWTALTQAVSSVTAELLHTRPATTIKPARSAAERREMDAQIKAVGNAVQKLNMPVADLLKTLQPPKDVRVALLGLEIDSHGSGSSDAATDGVLKITAEARTPQEMMDYVAFIDDRPFLRSVYLVKHEMNANSPERPYRFLLEAKWQE